MKTATSIFEEIISYFGQVSEIFENTAENQLQTDVKVDISHSAIFDETYAQVDIYLSNKTIFYFGEDLVSINFPNKEIAKITYDKLINLFN